MTIKLFGKYRLIPITPWDWIDLALPLIDRVLFGRQ